MRTYELIIGIFLVFNVMCSTVEERKTKDIQKVEFLEDKNMGMNGNLRIKFISDELIDLENVELRISKVFPPSKFEMKYGTLLPLPIIIPIGEQPLRATIHYPQYMYRFQNPRSETELQIKIQEGEYYVAIESEMKVFHFFFHEAKRFLFRFGFASKKDISNLLDETIAYDESCKSKVDVGGSYFNIGSCKKVKIVNEKDSYIIINISESKPATLLTRILMFIPGIIWLGPLTFMFPYKYREMTVELINPTEDIKEKMDNTKINEVK